VASVLAGRQADTARPVPQAIALKEKRPIRGAEIVAERPDGIRFIINSEAVLLLGPPGVGKDAHLAVSAIWVSPC
jgi:hypothetical protein